jgi:hypothetical protein
MMPLLVASGLFAGVLVASVPGAGAAVGVPTTYVDQSYASAIKNPSADKPQSKLWYTDGFWWALMVPNGRTDTHIFKLSRTTHAWADTGTVVDSRINSTGDALWTPGDRTLTVVTRDATANPRITRFTYDPATDHYTMDSGFPVTVNSGGGSESATIDRDSTGRLWITYTRGSRLWVAHSDPSGLSWTAGYNPAVGDYALDGDDISSVIAFNGSIGLMWSDQNSSAMRFAIHHDGDGDQVWSVEDALKGTRMADDHINLKQMSGDTQGRIFAAVKTSQGDSSNDPKTAPLVGVLVRTPGANGGPGTWKFLTTGTVADDHTRPIIVIDQTNQELYFLATAAGDIYYKKTSLANPDFSNQPGRGKRFVDAQPQVNNATASKDPVTAESGMVILAVAEGVKKYVHAEMDLAGGSTPPPPEDTEDPTVPQNLSATPGIGRVDLSWDASTDDIGVTAYVVRRDGQVIGQSSTTSFSNTTSVTPGATYTYTVAAKDAAGKTSAESDPATATVPPNPPPGDGISLRAATTAANSGQQTLSIPVPASQAGDLLLTSVSFRGKPTITAPAGWTLVRLDVNGTAMQQATFWHLADATEPGSYTWTFSAKPAAVGSMFAYAGVSTTSPIQTSAGQITAKDKSITAPTVTTTAPGSMLVDVFGVARLATITNPTGMPELTQIASPSGTTYPMTAESAGELGAGTGSTGARIATSSVSGPNIGQAVVLNPA